MITLNDKEVKIEHFPDGSQRLKLNIEESTQDFLIKWFYTSDEELFTLICIKKHIDNIKNKDVSVNLFLPYLVNARMDRVKNPDEVFTLKYFCQIINDLHFDHVVIFDPHSDVCTALLDRVIVDDAAHYFHSYVLAELSTEVDAKDLVIFFPDNGAMKRYSDGFSSEYERTYGSKNRDWRSGKILGYEIINPEVVKDKNVLIVDDICSYGGTFYRAAKALKAAGAKNIYLAVTHAENSMVLGDMYNTEGLIETIYTTNSIFNPVLDCHDKVVTMLI